MDEETKNILMWVGGLVMATQGTERVVDCVMTYVFQGKQKLTLEKLERLEGEQRARTLGRLMKQLRDRVELHEGLDTLLNSFVEHRNQLIHRLEDVPGRNLDTVQGRADAWRFLAQLRAETHITRQQHSLLHCRLMSSRYTYGYTNLHRFLMAWENQYKLGIIKIPEDTLQGFPRAPVFAAMIDQLVFAKSDSQKQAKRLIALNAPGDVNYPPLAELVLFDGEGRPKPSLFAEWLQRRLNLNGREIGGLVKRVFEKAVHPIPRLFFELGRRWVIP